MRHPCSFVVADEKPAEAAREPADKQ